MADGGTVATVDGQTVSTVRARWRRLRTGAWGLAIDGAAAPGSVVRVARRDGSTEAHVVGAVLWTDGRSTLARDGGAVLATEPTADGGEVTDGEVIPAAEIPADAVPAGQSFRIGTTEITTSLVRPVAPSTTPHADRARARKAAGGKRGRRGAGRYYAARGRCEDAPCCGCCDAGGGFAF